MKIYNYARILIFIITAVLLYFSTHFAVLINAKISDRFIVYQDKSSEIYSKDTVIYNIDTIELYNDLYSSMSISGWSFVDTDFDNTKRYVKFYFVSEENSYIVDTKLTWKDLRGVFGNKKLKGLIYEYRTEFSTLNMKNGEYNIYLETYENDKNYGMVNTGQVLSKKDGKVKLTVNTKDTVKVEINKSAISYKEKLNYHIDLFKYEDGIIYVHGWCFIKDISKAGKVYIGIKDDDGNEIFYSSLQMYRYDIGKAFKDDELSKSAFAANIVINDGERYKLSKIIVEYAGKYYSQNIGEQESKSENIKAYNYSSIFNIDKENMVNGNNVSMHIDNIIYRVTFNISGWAYLKDIGKTGTIYVGIKDKTGKELYYTTELEKRSDVVEHFNNNGDLLNSGFKANIKLDNAGDYTLSSIIIEYDGKYYKQEIGKQETKSQNIKEENYNITFNIDKKDMVNDDNVLMNIENINNGNSFIISGWAYLKDIGKTGTIYVGVKDKTGKELYYTTGQIERPDVVKHFNNNEDLLYSGFRVNIKRDNIKDYQLSSIVVEYDGKYYKSGVK